MGSCRNGGVDNDLAPPLPVGEGSKVGPAPSLTYPVGDACRASAGRVYSYLCAYNGLRVLSPCPRTERGARGLGAERAKEQTHMKVILLQEVPGLGQPGDVKEVSAGYARNFLLPRNLVTAATVSAMSNLNEQVASAKRRSAKIDAENNAMSEKLSNVTLTFAVRVGQGDRLYGSVTSQDIANALREQEGITIDRRSIQLKDSLRALGSFEAPVRVSAKHEAKVKVNIISSEQAATVTGATAATGPAPATE